MLPAGRIIGAADEEIEGDVEEIGQGDEDVISGFSTLGFIILDSDFAHADGGSNLFLRDRSGFAKGNQTIRERHNQYPLKLMGLY